MTWPRFDPGMPQSQVGCYCFISSFGMSECLQDICYCWTLIILNQPKNWIQKRLNTWIRYNRIQWWSAHSKVTPTYTTFLTCFNPSSCLVKFFTLVLCCALSFIICLLAFSNWRVRSSTLILSGSSTGLLCNSLICSWTFTTFSCSSAFLVLRSNRIDSKVLTLSSAWSNLKNIETHTAA